MVTKQRHAVTARISPEHFRGLEDLAVVTGGSVNDAMVYCIERQLNALTPDQVNAIVAAKAAKNAFALAGEKTSCV